METRQMKVLSETDSDHGVTLLLAAPAGSTQTLRVRENIASPRLRAVDGTLSAAEAGVRSWSIQFAGDGTGYTEKKVSLTW